MSHFDHVQASYADAGQREIRRLRDEVEALRGENKALKYMVERDTAAIQRVRGACEDGNARTVWGGDGQVWTVVDRDAVLNALDGDNDA
ncbi:MAG: hypothetical protein E6Q97_23580 [Desulfurellales bacterium]|nr:MAG: hypothetical protein E6Q97_23580 [Desulfurellales bacterium]